MSDRFKQNDLKSKEFLKSMLNQELGELSKLDEQEKNGKNEDLRGLITYYFELNKSTEERCLRLSNFSLQFLVLCIISIGLFMLYKETIGLMLFTMLVSFFSLHILFSLLIVTAHESGLRAKDYLYGVSPEDDISQVDSKTKNPIKSIYKAFSNLRHSRGDPAPYLESVRSFVRNFHEESIEQKIINNMEQLYLFQAENAYCTRLCFRIRRLRFWSLTVSIGASMGLGLAFVMVSGQAMEWLETFRLIL